MHGRNRPWRYLSLFLALLILSACEDPLSLKALVDGPDGKALTISPTSASLQINDSLLVETSGGVPPYEYSVVSGSGSFVGNTYNASAVAGTERVRVADYVGNYVEAVYTIGSGGLALGITPASDTVYTGESISFSPIGGTAPFTFTITLNGSNASIATGTYTAGNLAGTDEVTVTDNAANTATATISVQAKPLAVSPEAITVYVAQTVTFGAVGGDGPFTFSIVTNGSGAPPMSGSTYTAGSAPGIDTVTLTDGYDGRSRTASVTVVGTTTNVDYAATQIINIVPAEVLTGSNFDAEFSIVNNGSADGSRDISWTVYASTDLSIGGADDRIAASGSILSGIAAGSTHPVSFAGTWPSEAGNYYLLVDVYAADDLETANNRNQSASATQIHAPLSISPAVASVYTGQQVGFTVSGGTGSHAYTVAQSGSGTPSISGDTYTAGASAGIDIVEVSDTLYPSWPAGSATITVSEAPPPPPKDVEYTVSSFTTIDPAPNAGSPIGESFTLQNSGVDDGSTSVSWAAYLSKDNNLSLSAADEIVDSGSVAPLTGNDGLAGGTDEVSLAIGGNWPATAGTWYLKVKEWADDETTTNEWFASSSFAVQSVTADVDYYVSTPPAGGVGVTVGDPVSASFTVANQGSDAGGATVSWSAYISSDTTYNSGDTQIDGGSFAALLAGETSGAINIDGGTWDSPGSWYLLVRLQAVDEVNTTNNIAASTDVYSVTDAAATEPDYRVSAVSMYAPHVTTGSSVEESFTVGNIGSNGTENVTWTAYASADTVPDAGEEIGSGTIGPLLGGGTLTGIPTLGAVWPAIAGDYYLIIAETAADEINVNDYAVSLSRFTVNDPPDYAIQSVTFPVSAEQGTPVSGDFTIANIGAGDGYRNIRWEAFLSFDTGLSDDDLVIGSREIAALPAGGSSLITAAEFDQVVWPLLGRGYMLIRVAADDDGDTSNNRYVSPLMELYLTDSEGPDYSGTTNNGIGPSTVPIADTQHFGSLQQGQTIVVKGWLDDSMGGRYDTYAFDVGSGIDTIRSYAAWSTGTDVGALYIWDELGYESRSTNNTPDREPTSGSLAVSGWVSPETGYVSIRSYETVPAGTEIPYTIYISAQ